MAGDPETAAISGILDYVNVPASIGMAISADPMLLGLLTTTLSLEDLHDIIEVRLIDAHNRRVVRKAREA